MPIYEYGCAECGAHLEKMQKISDAPLTVCEKCGGRLEKQWSLSGFQFKGEGWYVTDYSNKLKDNSSKSATAESGEKKSSAESTDKTETASNKANDGATETKTKSESAEKKT